MLIPTRYTKEEGGDWLPWTFGEIHELALKPTGTPCKKINEQYIHALLFVKARGIDRWDNTNGWCKGQKW
jgi:hypothetical protein